MNEGITTLMTEVINWRTQVALVAEDSGAMYYVDHRCLTVRRGWVVVDRKLFRDKNDAHCYLIDLCNKLEG